MCNVNDMYIIMHRPDLRTMSFLTCKHLNNVSRQYIQYFIAYVRIFGATLSHWLCLRSSNCQAGTSWIISNSSHFDVINSDIHVGGVPKYVSYLIGYWYASCETRFPSSCRFTSSSSGWFRASREKLFIKRSYGNIAKAQYYLNIRHKCLVIILPVLPDR